MKTAIVGCGNIAKVHIPYILKTKGVRLVALCDSDEARARYMAGQYKVDKCYTDMQTMLDEASPHVVHILTPPQTHATLAVLAMHAGCHVLIEKPMCVTPAETDEIARVAQATGRKVCVDHTLVYDPIITRARETISRGEIGNISHLECLISDDYGERRRQGTESWWAASLPGGIFGDLLPHPLSVLLSFAPDLELQAVHAQGKNLTNVDELLVTLSSPTVTASVRLSLSIRPIQQYVRIYGSKGILHADYRHFALVRQQEMALPKAVTRLMNNLLQSTQLAQSSLVAVVRFGLGRLRPMPGLPELLRRFYASIEQDMPSPIGPSEGRKVVALSNAVWERLGPSFHRRDTEGVKKDRSSLCISAVDTHTASVLVTGGTGFIGRYLVKRLVGEGESVRVLCRESSDRSGFPGSVEFVCGDLRDRASLENAVQGMDTVYHLAATSHGDLLDYLEGIVSGTRNLFQAATRAGVRKFVYVSSTGILQTAGANPGSVMDEGFPLEARPANRGYYTAAKLEAEAVVRAHLNDGAYAVCILRPGIVYGPGRNSPISDAGFLVKGKFFLVPGNPRTLLPLVYVENLVDALLLAGRSEKANGRIYHVIDPDLPTRQAYLTAYKQLTGCRAPIVPVPLWAMLASFGLLQMGVGLLRGGHAPTLTYRLRCITADLRYDASRIGQELGWQARVSWVEGMRRMLEAGSAKWE